MADIFDAAQTPQQTQPGQAAPQSGDVFDVASQPQVAAQPQQQPEKPGFFEGLYDSTIGGLVNAAKNAPPPPTPTVAGTALHAVAGPVADILDPNHPVWGILQSAVGQAKAAIQHGIKAARAEGRGISSLAQGDLTGASAAGQDVADETSQAVGHGVASAVPVLGPAAAKAGQDIAENPSYGSGEAVGTIGQALLPEAVRGAGKTVGAAAEGAGKLVSGTKDLVSNIPADVEGKLVNAIGDAAENSGLERGEAPTLKGAVQDLAEKLKGRAQGVYKELDQEAPGFQELNDKIDSLGEAYKSQLNLDPVKADEIASQLKAAKANMDELLDSGQKARWKAADGDYSRFKALNKVYDAVSPSSSDLVTGKLTDVKSLHSAGRSLGDIMRGGNAIDYMAKAFGEDAGNLRSIVQKGMDMTSNAQAAKQFLTWIGLPGLATVGGAIGAKKILGSK